jgi:hypothetical protein
VFRAGEDDALFPILSKVNAKCDLVGSLSMNKWMNLNNIQFIVEDAIAL